MRLADALRVDRKSRVAFVGAGGKTTALFSLAKQLEPPVLCMNTAHLAVDQAKLADHHVIVRDHNDVAQLQGVLESGVILVTGVEDENGRVTGLDSELAAAVEVLAQKNDIPLLVEADGSRMRPLKAPAEHEPPTPEWVNHVVVVVGLTGIGKPLHEDHVFRPEKFSELTGGGSDQPVELAWIIRYLLHPDGGLKNIPHGSRRSVLFNQRDMYLLPESELFAQTGKLTPAYDAVLIGSAENHTDAQISWRHEAVGGVVLAAGGSTRMGQVKQLLPWRGKPLVRHSAETAIEAGLDPVVVVTGASGNEVAAALAGLPVETIDNPLWESGQSRSIIAGVQALQNQCGAIVFLLGDMPEIPIELIQSEISIFQREVVKIIVPRINGQRGNPVLFDRSTFEELTCLTGDMGGRGLFDQFPVRWLDWEAENPPVDIDTPDDYQNLIDRAKPNA